MSKSTPTVRVPSWKKEFDSRISAFSAAIAVEEDVVREILTNLGVDGETDQSLTIMDSEEFLPMGDLRNVLVDSGHTKIAQLRCGMPHLRGKTHLDDEPAETTNGGLSAVAGAIKDMVASNRPKVDWSDKELLEAYDQDTVDIADILSKRSHGRPCIVLSKEGTVNVDVSLKLLKIAKRQSTKDKHIVDSRSVRVYRPGEWLAKPIEESPFFRGEALVDGYCSKSGTQWNGISHINRVLVRIHVDKVETAVLSSREMRRIVDEARHLADQFEESYSEASLIYEELDKQDKLPTLKIMPSEVRDRFQGKTDLGI